MTPILGAEAEADIKLALSAEPGTAAVNAREGRGWGLRCSERHSY